MNQQQNYDEQIDSSANKAEPSQAMVLIANSRAEHQREFNESIMSEENIDDNEAMAQK